MGRQSYGRLGRGTRLGTVRAYHFGSLACRPSAGSSSGRRMAPRSTPSDTARNRPRCTVWCSCTPRPSSRKPKTLQAPICCSSSSQGRVRRVPRVRHPGPRLPAPGRTAQAADTRPAGRAPRDCAVYAQAGGREGRRGRQRRSHADSTIRVRGQPQHSPSLPGAGRRVPAQRRRHAGVCRSTRANRPSAAGGAAHSDHPHDEDAHQWGVLVK